MSSWLRRWQWRSIRSIRREFRAHIDRFKRQSKGHVRAALLADPESSLRLILKGGRVIKDAL